MTQITANVFVRLALCASLFPTSALAVDRTGKVEAHSTFCVDAKSAALLGKTFDEDALMLREVYTYLAHRRLCVSLPVAFWPSVTFKAKVMHVAKTDVWRVDWDGEDWYVAVDDTY